VSRLILVGGGCRSGKSTFALARARALGARRVFLATGQAFDGEMRARIAAHRDERGDDFITVEEPVALVGQLARLGAAASADAVLVDCLTLWLSNLMLADWSDTRIRAEIERLVAELSRRRVGTVLVTNEVGMGVVPESALGRRFRDLAGFAHQRLAAAADEVYAAMLGCVLRLRPGPVEMVAPTASKAAAAVQK
jgi:adenosylcobinamide kinase/adenosylcobinamide-phosphate guanylyltransferase